MPRARIALFASLMVAVPACGGTASAPLPGDDGGGSDALAAPDAVSNDALDEAAPDAIPPANGPFACGTATCAATEFCINPCCGGILPPCVSADDAGVCPVGTHQDSTCSQTPPYTDHCRPDPCQPPPPFCGPADACGSGFPGMVQGRQVSCVCG